MIEHSVHSNPKLNVRVGSVTNVIVEGAKCSFEKFMVQSVIQCIV